MYSFRVLPPLPSQWKILYVPVVQHKIICFSYCLYYQTRIGWVMKEINDNFCFVIMLHQYYYAVNLWSNNLKVCKNIYSLTTLTYATLLLFLEEVYKVLIIRLI